MDDLPFPCFSLTTLSVFGNAFLSQEGLFSIEISSKSLRFLAPGYELPDARRPSACEWFRHRNDLMVKKVGIDRSDV